MDETSPDDVFGGGVAPPRPHPPGQPSFVPPPAALYQHAPPVSHYQAAPPVAQRQQGWGLVTKIIIGLNVAVYLAMAARGVNPMNPNAKAVLAWGADQWALTTSGQWWRLLTSMFLHFGLLHLGFNMWALYVAGPITERLFGRWFYAAIYLFAGLFASLTSTWLNHQSISAGASGAIFGVFGALLAYALVQRGSLPAAMYKPIITSALACIGYNLFFGLTQAGIDNFAHVGGVVAGFVLGVIAARPLEARSRRQQTARRAMAVVGTAVAGMALIVAFIPKCNIAQERAFHALWQPFVDADEQFNGILHALGSGQIPPRVAGRRITEDVLPALATIEERYEDAPLPASSPSLPLKEAVIKYLELRRQLGRTIVREAENPDLAAPNAKEQAATLKAQMERVEEAMGRAWRE